MTGPTDGTPRGNPPVMTYDPAGNAVVDPREAEKVIEIANESKRSNDAKDAQRQESAERTQSAQPGGTSGRGVQGSGSKSSTRQTQKKGADSKKRR